MQSPYQVLNVNLGNGVPQLTLQSGYQGLFVILWWHLMPLGNLEIAAAQLPMTREEFANRIAQTIAPTVGNYLLPQSFQAPLPVVSAYAVRDQPCHLAALMTLTQPLHQLEATQPTLDAAVSVVICTRDRPEPLKRCLASLQTLVQPPHQIIVVDNAPRSALTRQLVAQFPRVQYVLEPRPGLSVARNTGIAHSKGDWIAFTDDDVVVHPNWLVGLQQGFSDAIVMAVTGLMLPAELESEAQMIFHRGGGGPGWGFRPLTFDAQFFNDMKPIGVPVWRIGAGANMAFRREIFDRLGYFDERLGAGASGCSEDSELWYRVLAAGFSCRYEPRAVIYHYHRPDLASLKHQAYHYMRGHVVALLVQFDRHGHWGNLRRLAIELPTYYVRRLILAVLNGFRQQHNTVWVEILGCLAGIGFYVRQAFRKQSAPIQQDAKLPQSDRRIRSL